MQPEPSYAPAVTTVLAIGSAVGPIFFGFVLWKMSQIFVSVKTFDEYKVTAEKQREEMRRQLEHIDGNVVTLLQRTAPRREHRES